MLDPEGVQREIAFQKMLINNMETVFKIFFRGMQVTRVRSKRDADEEERPQIRRIEQNLSELERRKIVSTRVRSDTKVKQYHAG